MPFETDDAWPAGLLTLFIRVRTKPTSESSAQSRYYAPYDALLNYCFKGSDTLYVAPQNHIRGVIDFHSMTLFDAHDARPVLIVDLKEDSWAGSAELRYRADEELRGRLAATLAYCPLPRLWGLSLSGTSVRVYRGDKVTYEVQPPSIMPPPHPSLSLSPTFLADEWDMDILSEAGFAMMKEIVTDIMDAAVDDSN